MPAVLQCLESARKSRSTIQEGTLIGAAIDSWLPDQLDHDDCSRLTSGIRLDGLKPAGTSVLSLIKRHSFHATECASLSTRFWCQNEWGSAAIRRPIANGCSHCPEATVYFWAGRHCPRLGPLEFCDSLIKTRAGRDGTPIPSWRKSGTVKLQAWKTVFVPFRVAAEVASSQSLKKVADYDDADGGSERWRAPKQ